MSHNKFMRRYNRHKTKHGEYFDRLAREALQKGGTTVQFGAQRFTVELHKRRSADG